MPLNQKSPFLPPRNWVFFHEMILAVGSHFGCKWSHLGGEDAKMCLNNGFDVYVTVTPFSLGKMNLF